VTTTSFPPAAGDSTADLVSITVTGSPADVRIGVRGEVDSSTAPAVRTAVERSLGADVRELTLDLAGVTFLDSAGLCVLAATHRQATDRGIRLRVLASERAVIRPLEITGLFALLAVEPAEPVQPGTHSAA
jgi:anti-sigma B factor antagonist